MREARSTRGAGLSQIVRLRAGARFENRGQFRVGPDVSSSVRILPKAFIVEDYDDSRGKFPKKRKQGCI